MREIERCRDTGIEGYSDTGIQKDNTSSKGYTTVCTFKRLLVLSVGVADSKG